MNIRRNGSVSDIVTLYNQLLGLQEIAEFVAAYTADPCKQLAERKGLQA